MKKDTRAPGLLPPIQFEGPCAECMTAAADPWSGVYRNGCFNCECRQLSHAPKYMREAHYGSIQNAGERTAVKLAVTLEYKRRQEKR